MRASDVARWASLLVPALAALAASSVLLVDYTRPVPVFCDPGGGCDAIKRTAFAHVLGVPTPAFGVAGFVLLGVLAALRGPRVRVAQACMASFAAVVAVVLLGVQVKLGQLCPYCMVADGAALVLLVAAVVRVRGAWDLPPGRGTPAATAGLLTLAMVVPGGLSFVVKPALPKAIKAELAKTPPGKVTVIDYADFECPWCRKNHKELAPVLEKHAAEVRLVRKHVPLWMHPHAMTAARAALCAEQLGKGEVVAEALFTVDGPKLDEAGCEKIATDAGLGLEPFRACVKDPVTDVRIMSDKAEFKATGGHGLPTVWIGSERIDGASDTATLEAAFDRVLHAK